DGNLHARIPYLNLLQSGPTARFLELTHQAYARHLGDDLGGYFMGLFTDEPSLMSLYLRPMPYRPLPWAPELPVEFAKRRGYALDATVLPALIADAGPEGEKIRYDYWLTVGEMVAENFFGQIQAWGRQHRIPSGGHLLLEENIAGHVPLYGDFFRCIRRLDAPSIDCLTSLPPEVPWQVARLLASAAELEGHPLVMSETSDHVQHYRPPGDSRPVRVVSEAEIRGTCNRLFVGGVNNITSYYSYAGLSDEPLRRLNEWVGRCCLMLRGGSQVADIGVVYPVESLWTKFRPSRNWTSEAAETAAIESVYRASMESLFEARRDFTILDSRALQEAAVEAGELVHDALCWRVVVLPCVDTLPLAAWENLARFVEGGGVVIALGALPANSEREFPCSRVRALAGKMFGEAAADPATTGGPRFHANDAGGGGIHLPAGSEALLPLVVAAVVSPDVEVSPAKAPVRVTHRRLHGSEVYFVINDSADPWRGELAFAAEGDGEQWDPATGRIARRVTPGSTAVELGAYGAAIFRFPEPRRPARHSLRGTTLPNLAEQPTPLVSPTAGKGEFVRGGVGPDADHSSTARPVWLADATLTKGAVDTHLFLTFDYPEPLDLSAAACLVVDTWVPAAQRTPARLLVILHQEGGGDFLADSGRSLAAAGWQRSYLPLSQFKLAGWLKDDDGQLDLKRVDGIKVGWGGYFGTQGETVSFSVAPPRVARIE
ncbi:MAG: hypothetical protein K9N23_21450, partial [Akkermansiaceae bacterium]|nr:hypothetical protein [Akkermansiaceae bacterium]